MSRLTVSLVQLCSGRDIGFNLEAVEQLLDVSLPEEVNILVLPECFSRMGGPVAEQGKDAGRICHWMTEIAKKYQCWLIGGSVPVFEEQYGRSYAACFVYNPQGEEVARYNKIHLFDAEVDDPTGCYRESDDYIPGNDVVVVDIDGVRLGLSICYDLRFPELYRKMVDQGAHILCIPAAFTKATGEAHWEVLLRARAIENQSYVLAANQCGQHSRKRQTYGHSMIIDPWGSIITQAKNDPIVISAKLDMSNLQRIRQKLPCLNHKRL